MSDNILTFDEAQSFLRTNSFTLYRLVREGKLPAFKIGKQWRFRRAALDEWIAAQEVQSNYFK